MKRTLFFYLLLCSLLVLMGQPIPLKAQSTAAKENPGNGIATFSKDTVMHAYYVYDRYNSVYDIRFKGDSIEIRTYPYNKYVPSFAIQFSSFTGFETQTGLAATQNQYAQGRSSGGSLQWRGPETGEIFTWGPAIRTLEYDGSVYEYDKNGRLVLAGTGNGIPAQAYNTDNFFCTGFSTSNNLQVLLPFIGKTAYSEINVGQKLRNSVIRNADFTNYYASLAFKNIAINDHFRMETKVSYNSSEDRLANRGANLSSVIGSLLSTPPTFDNRNGLSAHDAVSGTEAWQLPSGAIRSSAPGVVDNPYGLLATLPDKEKHTDFLVTAKISYLNRFDNWAYNYFEAPLEGFFQYLTDNTTNGTLPGFAAYNTGRLSVSTRNRTSAGLHFAPSYRFEETIKIYADYLLSYANEDYAIQNGFGFSSADYGNIAKAQFIQPHDYSNARTSHELKYGFELPYSNSWLTVNLAGKHYFSNTAKADTYTNFFPFAKIVFFLQEFIGDWWYDLDHLNIYFDAGKTIREAPLVYNSPVRSTLLPSWQYNQYYEGNEIYFPSGLAPETAVEYNTGINFQTRFDYGYYYSGNLMFSVNYFNNTTCNFIAPVFSSSEFVLNNVAQVKNYGWDISATLDFHTHALQYGTRLTWATYTNKVQSTVNDEYIPVAGFSNISTGLQGGNPVGAIYGTSWLRDAQGNRIIGSDGFPLVNYEHSQIGDPTPDWTAGIAPYLHWRGLHFSFAFEFSKGGDKWNGTAATLDCFGMSQTTADLRNTKGYIFDGVTTGGTINSTPVDFYNPALPVEQNRWVRYGAAGVGEEYICDASFVRLSNISLEYEFRVHTRFLKGLTVGLSANNLLLFTKYKGADPSSTLFNYPLASGLDLFNIPSVRGYLFTLKLNLRNY